MNNLLRNNSLAEVERLLALWKDAQPDLPLLSEAKALQNRLTAVQAQGE